MLTNALRKFERKRSALNAIAERLVEVENIERDEFEKI